MNIGELREFEKVCEQHYEYETSHQDAADSYSVLWDDSSNVKRFYFDMYSNVENDDEFTVYLGDDEVEIQLPRQLTEEEAEWFCCNTNFVVNGASDLAYQTYPTGLVVRAEYYTED